MYGTKYIVVTNAERQKIDVNIENPRVSREVLDLWEGDLGFVHKYIVDFYKKLRFNMKKFGKNKSLRTFSATNDNLNETSYSKHPENIPVLMYNWKKYFLADQRAHNFLAQEPESETKVPDEFDYYIRMVREGEFQTIKGRSLKKVHEGILDIYWRNEIPVYEKILRYGKIDDVVKMQFDKLRIFSLMKKNQLYSVLPSIPLEIALFKVKNDELERKLIATDKFSRRTKMARRHAYP